MNNGVNTIVANDNTVFLVLDKANGYTYTTYVGKNNVPSMTGAEICYLTSGGYATLVVVTDYKLATNNVVAYVPYEAGLDYVGNGLYAHKVYKVGETEPTTVYSTNAHLVNNGYDGFYTFTVSNSNQVDLSTMVWFMGTYDTAAVGSAGATYASLLWDRAYVRALSGNALMVNDSANGNAFADYNVDDASYILVDKYNDVTTLTAVDKTAIEVGQKVVVAYTKSAGNNYAKYVYIIAYDNTPTNTPATTAKVAFTLTVKSTNNISNDVEYNIGYVEMAAGTATFTLTKGSTQVDWNSGAPIAADHRVTGLTLGQYINPALGTVQTVTVNPADYGNTIDVNFVLYID